MWECIELGVWGKLSHDGDGTVHPLFCHLLDTGHVAVEMWRGALSDSCGRRLAEALDLDENAAARWIAFWASLHDIGKATPAFQVKALKTHPAAWRAVSDTGLPFPRRLSNTPHGLLTTVVLRRALADTSLGDQLATVLGGHHGVFPLSLDVERVPEADVGPTEWRGQQEALLRALEEHWCVAELPAPSRPREADQAVYMILAGLVCVADWIASCEDFFPLAGQDVDLQAYVCDLPQRARFALRGTGLQTPPAPVPPLNFRETFGFLPNAVQEAAIGAAGASEEPGLLLIECPMGEGKTEAAFAALHDGLRRLGHRGAYIALPTQATSEQIFVRFCKFAPSVSESRPVETHLLHGRAMLSENYLAIRVGDVMGDQPRENGSVVASEWFCASKRGLLAQYGVGTVDQALLGVLQVRHGFVRLFGMAGKLIILDEVHAYDTYTSNLLDRLLRWLGKLGCSVVLLSATLPASRRLALLEAYLARKVTPSATAYPRLIAASGTTVHAEVLPRGATKTVDLSMLPDRPEAIADALAKAVAAGGCAACVCNTVDRAQKVYRSVRARADGVGAETHLLHARFPAGRREQIERDVIARFGKDGWRHGRPERAIVVATQIIEQSLDLDFDLMVTDLAPVDLVLQRAGRLHRHAVVDGIPTRRPVGLNRPELRIVETDPATDGLPTLGVHELIYDRYVLLRSFLALRSPGREAIHIPDDMEQLIEAVYGDDPPDPPTRAWAGALAEARRELDRERHRDAFFAGARLIPPPDAPDGFLHAFNQELPEDETLAAHWSFGGLTRKARPSVQVVLLHRVGGDLFLDAEAAGPANLDRPPDKQTLLALLRNSVKLSRSAVVRHFQDQQVPAAWRRAPVLRNCYPLVLDDGRWMCGRTKLRLDRELGVVYQTDTEPIEEP